MRMPVGGGDWVTAVCRVFFHIRWIESGCRQWPDVLL